MTFEEYKNQTDPKRRPKVDVRRSECKAIFRVGKYSEQVDLEIDGKIYSYLYLNDPELPGFYSNCLRTIDKDGNPIAWSCFHLID